VAYWTECDLIHLTGAAGLEGFRRSTARVNAMGFFCDFDAEALSRIEWKIDRILKIMQSLTQTVAQEGEQIMTVQDDINTLVTEVERQSTVADSVKALLTQLSTTITNLKGQIVDPTAQRVLQQAVAAIKAKDQEIADAVVANTPAEQS
jgi:hypothetical protein